MKARKSLTAEDVARLAETLLSGCTIKDAALVCGLELRSVQRWRERGHKEADRLQTANTRPRPEEALYLKLWVDTETIRTRRKVTALATIQDLMSREQKPEVRFKAASFYLERGWPDEYGSRPRIPANEERSPDAAVAETDSLRREALKALDELEERRQRKTGT